MTTALPSVMGAHQAGPPDETGYGPSDVTNEPSTDFDKGDPGNGFDQCQSAEDFTSCQKPNGTLVLDGDYSNGQYPYFVDYNSLIRAVSSDADMQSEDYILPGNGWISAWWGWWNDKGRGGSLSETGQTVPGVVSKQADGVINDGHDDHNTNDGSIYTGEWDEFVWRGKNPWAGQTSWDADLGGKPSHDGTEAPKDQMYAFIHPGTHHTFTPVVIQRDADDPKEPDMVMDDRTGQAANFGPLPMNNQAYGWLSPSGWHHYQYDQSLLMSSTITLAVNPDSGNGGKKVISTSDAVDKDRYAAVHPQAEELYRTTVWDPRGDSQQGNNVFSDTNEEGLKQEVKDIYADSGLILEQIEEQYEDAIKPANPAVGAADDLTAKARPHEPDTGDESGFVAAANDDATYGNLEGDQGYYNEDADANYTEAYGDTFQPWFDGRTWMADAQFQVVLRSYAGYNAFLDVVSGDSGDRSAAPGLLWTDAYLGGWNDASADGWVGNIDEVGRVTDPGTPYADGRIDDPNDYDDHAQETSADPAKQDAAEWDGASASTVTATFCPLGPDEYDPSTGCPDSAEWGETGVYYLKDSDNNAWNPYDDSVEDAAGPVGPLGDCGQANAGPFDCDDDGERLSQYVQSGPITTLHFDVGDAITGQYVMRENILFPTGSLTHPVAIHYEGQIGEPIPTGDGDDLKGETIEDVDYLVPPE